MDRTGVLRGALQLKCKCFEINQIMMVQSGTRSNHEEREEMESTNPYKMQIMLEEGD
jgi:hypothetical protein